ncbi:LysR family transcriptional regulator [Micrococcus terreus]|uniref:DNA-binding transcriptional regulator, LysR family n=1 Tax=Micrococcus terreus TaxID=574650 RepID=A0A1I7MSZ8_9MICC|nr:LysR family transcriptional regulator [Micrococcus terreus]SFV25056.1 DNA-binding transcriptional regulator, LysR family [Micrococcus terreus]
MEVRQAEAFLAVAEELHFGRAADRLGMAQPPLSRIIKQLERQLGTTLFHRTTRQVELTAAGQALVKPADELVRASRATRRAVKSALAGEAGRVRLGFAGASVNRTVGELARQVRKERPGLDFEIHSSQFSQPALERILDGSLDLAIGRWDFLPEEVDSRVIAVEEVILALPASHPLAQDAGPVDMVELREEPWVVLPGGFAAALPNRLNTLAMSAGFVPRVAQTAPDSWTLMVLVAAELGCAVTLDSVRDNTSTPGVVFRPILGEHAPLEVRMIWRRMDDNPALHAVLDIAGRLPTGDPGAD